MALSAAQTAGVWEQSAEGKICNGRELTMANLELKILLCQPLMYQGMCLYSPPFFWTQGLIMVALAALELSM